MKPGSLRLIQLRYKPYNIGGKVGILLFGIAAIVGASLNIWHHFFNDYFAILLPFLILLIASKERNESDYMIRLKALALSVLINSGLVLIITWTVYGLDYGNAMVYLLISFQAIFLIVFYSMRFLASKTLSQAPEIQSA